MTDGQAELFVIISKKKHNRVHVQTTTRYGKSEIVSMAVLFRAVTFTEKWIITAGQKEKAGIILKYLIGHIFDSEYTRKKFLVEDGESAEKIRRFRNKNVINFKLEDGTLSEIMITGASNALGFGAPNIVEDEAALITDNEHSLVMRMLGDQTNNFLCKIGNPFESKHFRDSSEDPIYAKVIIDYHQAIREGRLTPQYIEEMRKLPNFGVLYEVKFPPRDQMDTQGWVPLMTKDDLDNAMVEVGAVKGFGISRAGVDVAGGGRNFSTIVNRWTNVARLTHKINEQDTMALAEQVIANKGNENLSAEDIAVDKVGIGRGMYDLLKRMIPGVIGINAGEKPISSQDQELFYNQRAMMFWRLREWILSGGKLERNDDWYQLTQVWYRTRVEGTKSGKVQIMSKEEMLKRGVESPDVADALAFTFIRPDVMRLTKIEDIYFNQKMKKKKKKKQVAGGYNFKMTNY